EAAGHGDRIAPLADAAGEGVARLGLDDPERRRGDATADTEVLEEVPDARLGGAVDAAGAGDAVDDRLIGEPGDREPDQCADDGDGHEGRDEIDRVDDPLAD